MLGRPTQAAPASQPTEDVFPCKDCGIWYRSERNLQAHLLYYCASRQSAGSPAAVAADEKPKETYPNERVCPFPQCRKSCPSASSLEIHMRSHSGEAPGPPSPSVIACVPTGAPSPGLRTVPQCAYTVSLPQRTGSQSPWPTLAIWTAGWAPRADPSLSPVSQENAPSCV